MGNQLTIIILISTIIAIIANWRIRKWQKEAATAYFIIGQKATTSDEREWAYRKALKYGHPKAKLFYIYAAADTFSGRKPLTPFTMANGKSESPITAIFYDYYIRSKHIPYASDIQQEITQRVLELKDGLNPSSDLYSEALKNLEAHFTENGKTPQGPTIIFMPCSSEGHTITISQSSQEASPKDIITIPLSMQSNTPIPVTANIAVKTATLLNHPQT